MPKRLEDIRGIAFKEAYASLNAIQKEAVDTIEGPVMVVAGPGTGKTTILTLRIAKILKETDTQPESILALTFTNSGVRAMRKKLIDIIGDSAYRVGIFTFHSFAENIIKEFSFYFPELEFANVIGDLDKVQILEKIIKDGDFKEIISFHDLFSSLTQIRGAIDDIKKEGINPEQFKKMLPEWKNELLKDDSIFYKKKYKEHNAGDIKPSEAIKIDKKIAKATEIAEVFTEYQNEIKKNGFYDFSDMILTVLRELESNENLKLDIQEKYQYFLVDEHQDTNEGQNKLIELLTDAKHLDGRPNIFTVGDEKQSIYRFQGASTETFKHFTSFYNDVKIINLKENYRSTKDILNSAHSLISHSISDEIELITSRDDNDAINVLEFSNYRFELLYIADEIKKKLAVGVDPNEIAIIYRLNKHIDEVKDVFSQIGIPFNIMSKDRIFEDRNIDNLVSLLRVIHNPNDNHHLGKVLLIDFLGFDVYETVQVFQQFRTKNRNGKSSLFQILEKEEHYQEFIEILKKLKVRSTNINFGAFFKEFLNDTGYLSYMLGSTTSRSQLIKIDTLYGEIKRQSQNNRNYSLRDFIEFIDAFKKYNLDIETNDSRVEGGVVCMTAHRSKGLEFEHVYLINTSRSNWEKRKGFNKISLPISDYKGDVDDERRLFYVAMTRAKNSLSISSSLSDWEGKEKEKSQFISEIDDSSKVDIDTSVFEKEHVDSLSVFIQTANANDSIFDAEYLKKLFLEKSLNVTSLNNYLQCEMKYLFRNLIQLPSEYSATLMFGDLVHRSLEKFFEQSKRDGKILESKILINAFKDSIENSSMYGDEYDKYLKRGMDILTSYHAEYKKKWSVNISNEKYIKRQYELSDKTPLTLSGIIDKIEYLDSEFEGKINIVDYKTGKPYSEKSTKVQREDLERQIVFYHLLLEGYNENKFIIENATLDFIQKNKKDEFEQHSLNVTDKEIKELEGVINTMADEVVSGEFLSKGCQKKDCEFCLLKITVEKGK